MKRLNRVIFLILVTLILTGCGPAGLSESTFTPMPTLMRTPAGKTTPIQPPTSPPTITTTPTSNPTPIGGGSGLIIFYRVYEKAKSEGSTEMVRFVGLEGIHSDGSGRFSLTGDTYWALNPTFSPDGNKIYYLEVIPETFKSFLHRINPDGSNDEQFAFPTIIDPESDFNYVTSFAISPDGKKIIVTTGGSNMIPPVMYLADFDGTGISNPLKLHEGGNAAWSPDGSNIYDKYGWLPPSQPDLIRILYVRQFVPGLVPEWGKDRFFLRSGRKWKFPDIYDEFRRKRSGPAK
jgi:hypothetical protein